MNLAAFAVVGMLQRDPARYGGPARFAGLAGRAPALAAAMAVLLLSLTGIPPTVGFFAKLYVLLATVNANLALAGGGDRPERGAGRLLLPARDRLHVHARPGGRPGPHRPPPAVNVALALSVAGVLLLGLFPEPILGLLRTSAGALF